MLVIVLLFSQICRLPDCVGTVLDVGDYKLHTKTSIYTPTASEKERINCVFQAN